MKGLDRLKLEVLSFSNAPHHALAHPNKLKSIETPYGLNLRELDLENMELESTKMVAGFEHLAVDVINLSGNIIRDLSALKGLPLKKLILQNNGLTSIKELVGIQLVDVEELDVSNYDNGIDANRITDLRALLRSSIKTINIKGNKVSDRVLAITKTRSKICVIEQDSSSEEIPSAPVNGDVVQSKLSAGEWEVSDTDIDLSTVLDKDKGSSLQKEMRRE